MHFNDEYIKLETKIRRIKVANISRELSWPI